MNKENLSFDINVFVSSKELYRVEVTENYEGDKFHCVVFDSSVLPLPIFQSLLPRLPSALLPCHQIHLGWQILPKCKWFRLLKSAP